MRTRRRAVGIGTILATFACSADPDAKGTPEPSNHAAPPPVTEPIETLAGYTQTCGVELGPVPGFDCAAGHRVPVTVNGVEADAPETCDRPSLIRACAIPVQVGRLPGQTWDFTNNPDVTWAFICVSWPDFNQLAIIGHHRQTGATCFFESQEGNTKTEAPPPLPEPRDPSTAHDDFWLTPAGVAKVGCPDCHASDPWVHSPFIDQIRDPDDASLPLIPSGADRSRPYYAVASPFESWPRQIAIEGNACLQCHRIGTGALPRTFVQEATNQNRFTKKNAWAKEWPQSHWMPPTGASSLAEWEATYSADVTAVLNCLEATSQEHCTAAIPSSR